MAVGQRKYTESERALTLTVLAATGSIEDTSRLTGIPRETISGWRHGVGISRDVAPLANEAKLQLAAKLWSVVNDKLTPRMSDPKKLESATLSQVAIALGVLTDKALLLEDVATAAEIIEQARIESNGSPLALEAGDQTPEDQPRDPIVG